MLSELKYINYHQESGIEVKRLVMITLNNGMAIRAELGTATLHRVLATQHFLGGFV